MSDFEAYDEEEDPLPDVPLPTFAQAKLLRNSISNLECEEGSDATCVEEQGES